jgi:hypothetical protein
MAHRTLQASGASIPGAIGGGLGLPLAFQTNDSSSKFLV